jgi:peptide/nickel transport system substrate-binding protein
METRLNLDRIVRRLAALMGLAVALLGAGGATAQNLTLGTKLELNTLDPHFFAAFPTGSSHPLIYEHLVALDEKLQLKPNPALSWKSIDPLTWEIKLRQGVVFHNGAPFTADDVIFTWERVPNVPNSPNSFSQFTRSVEKITRIDSHTLQMKTTAVHPGLPMDLANVLIVSASVGKGVTTQDFNSGKAAIGTGPYKLVQWANGERLVVERNERYWGPKPTWARVTEVVLAKDAARLAALLSGQVDAIDAVPSADLDRLRKDTDFRWCAAARPRSCTTSRWTRPARSRPSSRPRTASPWTRNPLKDARVRKALSLALNRGLIVERVLEGSGVPAGQMLSRTCSPPRPRT